MRHDAFISFNHGADSRIAAALERGLERLAKPWHRSRSMSVFRAEGDLGLTPALWTSIQTELDGSRYLILLACPESAASPWVDREVEHWCATRGVGEMLIVLTGGELHWDSARSCFSDESTAASPALRRGFSDEPLHLDLRWARDASELSMELSAFRSAVTQLASPIRGIPPADLEGEDIRQHRRTRRLARATVATVATLAVVAVIAAVAAVSYGRSAERSAQQAIGRQLGLAALDLPSSELDRALLLSLVASDLDREGDPERHRSSRTLIGRNSRLDRLLHVASSDEVVSVTSVTISPDGRRIAALVKRSGTQDAEVVTWIDDARTPATTATIGAALVSDLWFVPDADPAVLVSAALGGAVNVFTADGTDEVGARALAVDRSTGQAVVSGDGVARVVDVVTRGELARFDQAALAAIGFRAVVVASPERIARFDGTGTVVGSAASDGSEIAVVAVGPDDDVAAVTGSRDGRLTTFSRLEESLEESGSLSVPDEVGPLTRLFVAPDGRRLLVVGDQSALVDLTTGRVVASDVEAAPVAAVDPSGRFVAIGGRRLVVWDLTRGDRILSVPERVGALDWNDGCATGAVCRLVTAGESVDVWDPVRQRRVRLIDQTNAQSVAVTADGSTVVTAGWGSSIAVWTLGAAVDDSVRVDVVAPGSPAAQDPLTDDVAIATGDGVEIRGTGSTTRLETGQVARLRLTAAGTRLLTEAAGDGRVALWDVTGAGPLPLDPTCRGDLVAVSPNGTFLAVHDVDGGRTAVCRLSDGAAVATARLRLPDRPASVLAVDDDGHVALGRSGTIVEHFRRRGDQFVTPGIGIVAGTPNASIRALSVVGDRIAAGIQDPGPLGATGQVLVWDLGRAGQPVVFETDFADVPAVALVGADADLVVTAGQDRRDGPVTVQVWESETRRRLGRGLSGLEGEMVLLGGDESGVVGVDSRGAVVRWRLDRDPRGEVCEIVGRSLTRAEWDRLAAGAVADRPFDPVCPPS